VTQLRNELRRSALQILRDFGETLTLRTSSQSSSYDPATGKPGAATPVDHSVKVVFVQFKKHEFEGDLVQKDDRKAFVEVRDGVNIVTDDRIIGVGNDVKVVRIREVLEGSTGGLLYILQVRG
jgi:hypothetical protein